MCVRVFMCERACEYIRMVHIDIYELKTIIARLNLKVIFCPSTYVHTQTYKDTHAHIYIYIYIYIYEYMCMCM